MGGGGGEGATVVLVLTGLAGAGLFEIGIPDSGTGTQWLPSQYSLPSGVVSGGGVGAGPLMAAAYQRPYHLARFRAARSDRSIYQRCGSGPRMTSQTPSS